MIDYEELKLWPEEQLHPTKEPLEEAEEKFCEISGAKLDKSHRPIICDKCGCSGTENNTTFFGGNPSCQHRFVLNEIQECDHEYLTVGCPVCDSYKMDPNNPAYLIEECQHESDGGAYCLFDKSPINVGIWSNEDGTLRCTPHQFKCKKCGDFYQ
jgi:hypothetical protein